MIYITILHLGPALNIFGMLPGGRVYILTTVANLIAVLFTLNYIGRVSRSRQPLTLLDVLVFSYLAWSCLSIILYFQDNNPTALEGYLHGIHDFTLPICGYFIAKHLTYTQLIAGLRYVVLANAAAMLLGIFLYYQRPEFYTNFLRDNYFSREGVMETWQVYGRMQTYFGSTAVGILSALSIVLLKIVNPRTIFSLGGIGTFCTAVLLSRQRGGMLAAAIALVYFLLFNKGRRLISIAIIGCGLFLSFWLLSTVEEEHEGVIESIWNRTSEVEDIFAVRSGYTTVFDYIIEFPFGVGIGGTGASSDGLQERGKVVDANFMRILADLGIQGLGLFIFVLLAAALTAMKRTERMGWLTIIVIYVLVALGTNTFDSHYVSHLFWIVLAAMDTPNEQKPSLLLPVVEENWENESNQSSHA